MNYLLQGVDDSFGRPLDDLQIVEEVLSFFFAGSGTTANTLIFLIWAVLKEPNVHELLFAELKEAFPDTSQALDMDVLQNLPYLDAVITETLRLYPTIPGTQPRYTLEEDVVLLGKRVPKRVRCCEVFPLLLTQNEANAQDTEQIIVGVQNYSLHRNPRIYPRAAVFDPARWLDSKSDMQKQGFNGFGTGPRSCIGRK